MDFTQPLLTISPGPCGRVLSVLARLDHPASGNEVARRAGMGRKTAVRALEGLVNGGVVWSAQLSHVTLFMLDPEHMMTPIVRRIATLVDELADRVGELCTQWAVRPDWVGIAEAFAGTPPQLLIVPPDEPFARREWEDHLAALRDQARRWTGCEVEVVQARRPFDLDRLGDIWRGPVQTAFGTAPVGLDVVRPYAPDAPQPSAVPGARSWQL
jgi:hypothetical protein